MNKILWITFCVIVLILPVNAATLSDALKTTFQNNLELLEKFKKKSVIFGAIAIASSRLEREEEIIDRINSALLHIDRERLVIAPDCGLGLLTPDLAESKLRVMCSAVRRVD